MCETAKNATNTTERKMPNTVLKYLPWTQFAFQNKNKNNKTKRQKIKKTNKNQADTQRCASIFPFFAFTGITKKSRLGKASRGGKDSQKSLLFLSMPISSIECTGFSTKRTSIILREAGCLSSRVKPKLLYFQIHRTVMWSHLFIFLTI